MGGRQRERGQGGVCKRREEWGERREEWGERKEDRMIEKEGRRHRV